MEKVCEDANLDEQAMIEAAQADPQAFLPLYDYYFRRVYNTIAYRVSSIPDAEDLTAQTFMKAFEKIGSFQYRGEGSFAAWLFRIAYNHIADHHRRRPPVPIDIDEVLALVTDAPSPDAALMQKEKFAHLHRLIHSLPPKRQEVLTLRFFGGLTNKAIASVLGVDERTVASNLSRALQELQRKFQVTEQDFYDPRS